MDLFDFPEGFVHKALRKKSKCVGSVPMLHRVTHKLFLAKTRRSHMTLFLTWKASNPKSTMTVSKA